MIDEDITRAFHNALKDIATNRDKIIEDYMRFWIAVKIPPSELTPEFIADKLVLCTSGYAGFEQKFWLEFKKDYL